MNILTILFGLNLIMILMSSLAKNLLSESRI